MIKIPRSIKAGLDTEHFDIIRVMSLGHFYPIIVMRDKRAEAKEHWCLQYQGTGHYFKTLKDVSHYCSNRKWQSPLIH